MKKKTPDETLEQMIEDVTDGGFECGEWNRDDNEETYEEVYRLSLARQQRLLRYIHRYYIRKARP
jgi:hypothetical protein